MVVFMKNVLDWNNGVVPVRQSRNSKNVWRGTTLIREALDTRQAALELPAFLPTADSGDATPKLATFRHAIFHASELFHFRPARRTHRVGLRAGDDIRDALRRIDHRFPLHDVCMRNGARYS